MNHTIKQCFEKAKEIINDECVFTEDQITLLQSLIDTISYALETESNYISDCVCKALSNPYIRI